MDSRLTMLAKFHEQVSILGLDRVLDRRNSLFKRVFWALIIVAAFSFLIYHMWHRIAFYFAFPILVDVRVNYDVRQTFPSVTICNINPIRYSLDNPFLTEDDRTILRLITGQESSLPRHINSSLYDWDGFVARATHDLNSMLIDCHFQENRCNSSAFTPVHTDHSMCYTFNHDGLLTVSGTGSQNGLRIVLDSEREQYSSDENTPDEVGFFIAVHNTLEIPLIRSDSISAGCGMTSNIGLKTTRNDFLPLPHGQCGNPTLWLFPSYSQSRCHLECLTNVTLKICGCRYPYMEMEPLLNIPFCDPISGMWGRCSHMLTPHLDGALRACFCPVSCVETRYAKSVSNAHLNPTKAKVYNMTVEQFQDVARINVYFEELRTTTIEQHYAYSWLALMSDMGGAAGLMLGCCLFTFVQIIDFLLSILLRNCGRQKSARFRSDGGLDELDKLDSKTAC